MDILEKLLGNHSEERHKFPFGYARKEVILDKEGNPIDWKYLDVNDAFERHTGISVDGLVGKCISDITSNREMYEEWLNVYFEVAFRDMEEEFISWDERFKRWLNVNVYSPKPGQVVVLFQDITKFEEQRRMHADILSNISDAVFITDSEGQFKFVGPNSASIFGYKEGEILKLKRIQSLFGEGFFNIQSLDETGEILNIEAFAHAKSGMKHDFLINIKKMKDAGGSLLFTCREVTERLRIEKEREQNAAQLKAFMNAIPDMVWIKDKKGRYITCNKEFEKLYGVSEAGIKGKDDYHFLSEELASLSRQNDKATIANGGPIKIEETLTSNDVEGETIIVETTKTPVYNSSNDLVGVLGVARDITKRKSIEMQLIKANHDLNLQIQKLNLAMDNNGILAWETDLENSSTEVFPKGVANKRMPKVNIISLEGILHQIRYEHRFHYESKLQELQSGEIDHLTCEFQVFDEKLEDWIWHQGDISVLEKSDDGFPKRIFGTILNINDKKDSERLQVLSQEQERIRVARDIHDSIGQLLVGTRLMLNQTLEKDIEHEVLKELNGSIDQMLGDMIRESRLIINNFGISITENGDLKQTFIELAEKMKKIYKGDINLYWHGESNVNSLLLAVHLFRIYQEALTNAIKYSNSDKIEVDVRNQSQFMMVIRDFGNGFDVGEVTSGFGIQNMNDRANQIGGAVNIISAEGMGTTVKLML